jgi:peroxiredoxin
MFSLKRILPIAVLIALIVWGIFDVVHKNNINNASKAYTNTNVTAKANDNGTIEEGLQIGNLAPDFELTTLDGKKVKLSDYRGKKVVLNFWATWCPPCKAEIPDLEKFYSDFKDRDIVILGVDLTQSEKSQESVSMFAGNYGITYPILLDKEGTANETYQVSAIPTSYIIDTKGVIVNKVVGPMDYETMKGMLAGIN